MFDLNPDVGHLMLDRDLGDPFDRDLPSRPRGGHHPAPARVPGRLVRARQVLGVRLIALGAALAIDDGVPAIGSPAVRS